MPRGKKRRCCRTLENETIFKPTGIPLCRSQSLSIASLTGRLHGSGFRIRVLFTLKHFHHRIQGSRTGNHRTALKYHARNHRLALCSFIGKVLRKTGPHFSRRSYHYGYDSSHYHPLFRAGIRHSLYLSWFHCGL